MNTFAYQWVLSKRSPAGKDVTALMTLRSVVWIAVVRKPASTQTDEPSPRIRRSLKRKRYARDSLPIVRGSAR